jgi:hypothetical protein
MPRNYDGRLARHPSPSLHAEWTTRYRATQCVGNGAWELLLECLRPWLCAEGLRAARSDPAPIEDALMTFLGSLRPLRNRRRPRRLFVAYRQADILEARRVAEHASRPGFAWWLDAHDELRFLPGMEGNPVQEVLALAAMEMGLLNASHALIVHAPGPECISGYLLGRAREHGALVRSTALWRGQSADSPRQASLVPMLQHAGELTDWLEGRTAHRVRSAAMLARVGPNPTGPERRTVSRRVLHAART